MPAQRHPVSTNIEFLRQGAQLIRRLDEPLFTGTTELLPGGTVGGHFRHCLDFYRALLGGLACGRVDYDRRDRSPDVETVPNRALESLVRVIAGLEALGEADLERPVEVRGDGPAEEDGWSRSTVGREFQYLLSHTIHHYALIGSLLRAQGFEPGSDFGVAPSTLRHWKSAGVAP